EGLWESLLDCIDSFDELNVEGGRSHLQDLRDAARHRRDNENVRRNSGSASADYCFQARRLKLNKKAHEKAFTSILTRCDPTSAPSLDEAIRSIQADDGLSYDSRNRLFDEIRKTCPFNKRIKFLQ